MSFRLGHKWTLWPNGIIFSAEIFCGDSIHPAPSAQVVFVRPEMACPCVMVRNRILVQSSHRITWELWMVAEKTFQLPHLRPRDKSNWANLFAIFSSPCTQNCIFGRCWWAEKLPNFYIGLYVPTAMS